MKPNKKIRRSAILSLIVCVAAIAGIITMRYESGKHAKPVTLKVHHVDSLPSTHVSQIVKTESGYLYALADNGIFRSTDLGANWINTIQNLTLDGNHLNGSVERIQASPLNNNYLWALIGGRLYLTKDNAETWNRISPLEMSPITDFALSSAVIILSSDSSRSLIVKESDLTTITNDLEIENTWNSIASNNRVVLENPGGECSDCSLRLRVARGGLNTFYFGADHKIYQFIYDQGSWDQSVTTYTSRQLTASWAEIKTKLDQSINLSLHPENIGLQYGGGIILRDSTRNTRQILFLNKEYSDKVYSLKNYGTLPNNIDDNLMFTYKNTAYSISNSIGYDHPIMINSKNPSDYYYLDEYPFFGYSAAATMVTDSRVYICDAVKGLYYINLPENMQTYGATDKY